MLKTTLNATYKVRLNSLIIFKLFVDTISVGIPTYTDVLVTLLIIAQHLRPSRQ